MTSPLCFSKQEITRDTAPGGEVRASINSVFCGSIRKLNAPHKLVADVAVVTMIDLINRVTGTPFVTIATMVTKITKVICCIYANAL